MSFADHSMTQRSKVQKVKGFTTCTESLWLTGADLVDTSNTTTHSEMPPGTLQIFLLNYEREKTAETVS
jgi:hypothetical protein